MLMIFWISQGVLLGIFRSAVKLLPPHLLWNSVNAIYGIYPDLPIRVVLLLRGNTRPHTARLTKESIQELWWEFLQHLPCRYNFIPSDLHLFGPLKQHHGGRCFHDDEAVENEVHRWSRQQTRIVCCMFRGTGKVMGQVYQCWRGPYREINVCS